MPAISRLFATNERLVFDYVVEGGGKVFVVMVGALNVGRMQTRVWPEFATNMWRRQFLGATRRKDSQHRWR